MHRVRSLIHRLACRVARATVPHRLATGETCAYDGHAQLIVAADRTTSVRLAIGGRDVELATKADLLHCVVAARDLRSTEPS